MGRRVNAAMTTLTSLVIAGVMVAPVVSADPPAKPQAGASCEMAQQLNAQTFPNGRSGASEPDVLMCVKGDQHNVWQHIDGLQRPVHYFYTYGPTETLFPADLNLGEFWDGVGATQNDLCAETQSFNDGRSETLTNNGGQSQYFGFTLKPEMTRLDLGGNCRWQISPCSGRTGPTPCTAGHLSPGIDQREREI
jgi:hypothetical protein